ncbi:MAG: GDYXXLXY domain-containing protein [Usitatibacter sp.]
MKLTRILIGIGAALVLIVINISILGKEHVRKSGELVFLELQPRDPRSLMQGDYMTLDFPLARQVQANLGPGVVAHEGEAGVIDITLDEKRVARVAEPGKGSLRIRYRIRKGAVWLGTNAFFFEEGSEQRFAPARFGEFRVDERSGESVLVGLRDANLAPL